LKTDVALMNGGGIRSDRIVPVGPLTRRDVAGLLPFGNVAMVLEVTGRQLREALEHGLARLEREGGGFLQVSGVTLMYDPSRPPGSRIMMVEVGGAPLDPARRYTVAVVDYVANGGDGFASFHDSRVLLDGASGPLLADVLLQAVTTAGTITPQVDGRIRAVRRGGP
jgi:2',3'-cyclic-nucleotide 2'-phosphodiesterase (5'-nucleotidase family)